MPAAAIRIALFLLLTTLASLAFELQQSGNALPVRGEIVSISGTAKGWDVAIQVHRPDQINSIFTARIGPGIKLLGGYRVGDHIPVLYCEDCYPVERIGDFANTFSLSLMFLMLDILAVVVFAVVAWQRKHA